MTLAEYVDGLAKAGTIDGNIAERIMGLHREATFLPCVAIRNALMPIVAEMDEYHGRCTVEVQCAHDKFWDEHEPQTIGDFSDRITDAVANLCGEIASDAAKLREALEIARLFVKGARYDIMITSGEHKGMILNPKGTLVKMDAALAAPPRNCDILSADQCKQIFAKEMEVYLPQEATDGDREIARCTAYGVIDTLFAPFTEQNGGADGSK